MKSNVDSISCTEIKTALIAEEFKRKVLLASRTFYCSRVRCVCRYTEHSHNKVRDSFDVSLCIDQYRVILCSSEVDCVKYEFTRVHYFSATFLLAVLPPKEPLPLPSKYYLIVDAFDTRQEARNLIAYLKTKFVYHLVSRFCTERLGKGIFKHVPVLEFKEVWTDQKLCDKYELTQEEREFIESMIKPMDKNAADDGNSSGVCDNG